ncbi:MAG: MBL fold metallo-hydrolase [Solirubrobacteraceae bacterium]
MWLIRGGLPRTMNVYLLEDGDGVVVYDAGEKGMADVIMDAAKPLGAIRRVVLGHGDTDHRGAAPPRSPPPGSPCSAIPTRSPRRRAAAIP